MAEQIISFKGISKQAPKSGLGEIKCLDISINPGEVFTILDMNEWERRAIVDLVSAMDNPDEGAVIFKGTDFSLTSEAKKNELRGRIGVVTDPPVFLNNVRIMENMRLPLRYHSKCDAGEIDRILSSIFEELEMGNFQDVIPSHFDRIFLAAAALARAISNSPDILLLERPVECLGKDRAYKLTDILKKRITKQGGAVLILTTQPRLAFTLSDRIAIFEKGVITDLGTGKDLKHILEKKTTEWRRPKDVNESGA